MDPDGAAVARRAKITDPVLVISQTDRDGYREEDGGRVRVIDTRERGLSNSRNMAIARAKGDICLLADDDEVFRPDVRGTVEAAYRAHPDADVIAFCLSGRRKRYPKRAKRLGRPGTLRVSSCEITFRREAVQGKVSFDPVLGAGTPNGAGEENKFLWDCLKAGLRVRYCPQVIAALKEADSSWFSGYTDDYFRRRGAVTRYIGGPVFAARA